MTPTQLCQICGGQGRSWLERLSRRMVRCECCDFSWVVEGVSRSAHGSTIYEDDETVFEDGVDYYLDDTAKEAARDKLEWVKRFVRPGGAVLDVGSNVGMFASVAQTEFDVVGIEPSRTAADLARSRYGAPVEVGSIYEHRSDFVGRFDAVTLFDVFEHLPDGKKALRQCLKYLAPDGHLFLSTPNKSSWVARLAGRHWHYIDLKEHIALYNRFNLTKLVNGVGFRLVGTRTIGRRYRCSYIERRLRFLGRGSIFLRLIHLCALPLLLFPGRRIPIHLGDVLGIVVRRDS